MSQTDVLKVLYLSTRFGVKYDSKSRKSNIKNYLLYRLKRIIQPYKDSLADEVAAITLSNL